MTEKKDWLDEALARHPDEPVPPGFKIRLMGRIGALSSHAEGRGRLLPFRIPLLLAAGFGILATGYWMGMGAPSLSSPQRVDMEGDLAALDLEELYANRDLLEAWDLLQDPELVLGFGESLAGAWAYGQDAGVVEAPR